MVGAARSAGGGSPFGSAASSARVYGWRGLAKTLVGFARFDNLSVLHHDHVVGDAPDNVEVVGDEQHRHAELGLQVFEQLEDLRLHGDVERRRRLVGDQEIGAVGERHGDHHALALTARKLVRIGAEPLSGVGDADLGQKLDDSRWRRRATPVVERDDLADLPLDRMQRIERGHRLLKNHGDGRAAHLAQFVVGHFEHVAAAEKDLAGRIAGCG